jgi:pyruvate dehydrogenase E1 component beta subunit
MVVDEGPMIGGVTSEIAAIIQENLFSDLKGPVIRIGAYPLPPPHSPPLVEAIIPSVDRIVSEALRLVEGKRP